MERPSWSAPPLIIGQNFLWVAKEHNVAGRTNSVPGELKRDKFTKGLSIPGYLILCSTCPNLVPLGQDGLYHKHCASCCPSRGSFVILSKEQVSWAVPPLCCSSPSQRQSCHWFIQNLYSGAYNPVPGPDKRSGITLSLWTHLMLICQWDKISQIGQTKFDRGK